MASLTLRTCRKGIRLCNRRIIVFLALVATSTVFTAWPQGVNYQNQDLGNVFGNNLPISPAPWVSTAVWGFAALWVSTAVWGMKTLRFFAVVRSVAAAGGNDAGAHSMNRGPK